MPRVNIYIRNDDAPKWDSIADKPAWIHDHLNGKLCDHNLQAQVDKFKKIYNDDTPPNPLIDKPIIKNRSFSPSTTTVLSFDRQYGKCGHALDSRGKCSVKECKGK
jgi:hypothetical protein